MVSKPQRRNQMRIVITCCLLLITLLVAACGPKRPVLYPNDYLKQVGPEKAEQDIDDCIKMANDDKAGTDKTKKIAKNTGTSAVVGAATGAVVGAIAGNAGMGAAIGAAGSGVATLGMGVMRSDEPDSIFIQFVDRCLREKGYQPLGWK
jgi:predicted small lipoprotein YifL